MSLKLKLLQKIQSEPRFWHKGELADYARDLGFSSENSGRRLRELEVANIIQRRLNSKGCAIYCFGREQVEPGKTRLIFGSKRQIYELKYKKII